MIDRDKVMTLLHKRFPGARLCDLAAAANAIVGLEPEFDALPADQMTTFECAAGGDHYTRLDVENGTIRLYRRTGPAEAL